MDASGVPRFCTSCGGAIREGDRFCASCGAAVDPGEDTEAADVLDQGGEDPLADWERHRQLREPAVRADEAPTEQVPAVRHGDTAILPEVPPAEPATPAPGPSPPPPPVATAPRPGFPLGATVALVAAIAVILSAVLPWASGPLGRVLPRDVDFPSLLRGPGAAAGGPSMGIVLLWAGVAGGLMALLTMVAPALKFVRRLIGLATLAIPALFVFRVAQGFLGELAAPVLVLRSLAAGVYVAAAGALVQIVAGRWFRR